MNIQDIDKATSHLAIIQNTRARICYIQESTVGSVNVNIGGTLVNLTGDYLDAVRATTLQWLSERVDDEIVALRALGVEVEQ